MKTQKHCVVVQKKSSLPVPSKKNISLQRDQRWQRHSACVNTHKSNVGSVSKGRKGYLPCLSHCRLMGFPRDRRATDGLTTPTASCDLSSARIHTTCTSSSLAPRKYYIRIKRIKETNSSSTANQIPHQLTILSAI